MINKTRIGARLFAGFGILVLFCLGYALYSIIQMAKLASITESLYQSPFEVRRAIRDLENDVLKMELLVEESVSAKAEGERSMLAGRIYSIEADSSAELAVLLERFLGDRQAVAAIQDSLSKWRSVRDQLLSLEVGGDIAGAVSLKTGEYDRLLDVLDSNIQYVKAFSATKAQAFYEDSLAIRNRTIALSMALMLALTAAGTVIALLIGLSIRRPIERLIAVFEKIAAGDLGSDLKIEGSDEMAKLGATFMGMQEDLRRKAELAKRVAGGDFSARLEPTGPADELGKALSAMVLFLHEASISMARSVWVREGVNGANEATRGDLGSEEYSRRALEFVATYGRAGVGVLCAARGGNGELERLAGYAFAPSGSRGLRLGEGLAGQAAASGKLATADHLPEDYLAVSSTIGESRPRSVAALPLMSAESAGLSAIGVIELGFTSRPSEDALDFLRAVAPGLSAGLASALARERMKLLLDESRSQTECLARQTELLARQEEELRQGNEELEQQAEELRCSEEELLAQREELLAQREELRTANEKLEDAGSALRGKARDLEEAGRYKSAFLANMSHELRTPLNSILILSQLITEDGPGSRNKRLEYARGINDAGNDLLALISDILDLSKIEAGKVDLCLDSVNLLELTLEIKALFSPIAEKKGIGFRVEAADGLPPSIVTDRGRLSQILKNLVSNAIKFTERGEVVVTLGSSAPGAATPEASCGSDATIWISVRDSGIGVPDDKKEAIFAAFQQAESSTTRKYGGTGLGLTIARELARLLDGDIELQSVLGQGSVFTLIIPMSSDGATRVANAAAAVHRDAASARRKERILIIEDDGRQLEAMTELLGSRPRDRRSEVGDRRAGADRRSPLRLRHHGPGPGRHVGLGPGASSPGDASAGLLDHHLLGSRARGKREARARGAGGPGDLQRRPLPHEADEGSRCAVGTRTGRRSLEVGRPLGRPEPSPIRRPKGPPRGRRRTQPFRHALRPRGAGRRGRRRHERKGRPRQTRLGPRYRPRAAGHHDARDGRLRRHGRDPRQPGDLEPSGNRRHRQRAAEGPRALPRRGSGRLSLQAHQHREAPLRDGAVDALRRHQAFGSRYWATTASASSASSSATTILIPPLWGKKIG